MLPRTRFPFFSGDYTEKFLHEAVLELKSGLSRMFSDSDIGLPVIRSNNIKDYCLDFNDLKYWFEEDTQGAKTSNYHLRDGDILVNFINSQAQIGKSAIYQNALNRDCIYTTNILSLRINKEYSSRFIFFFFQTKKYNDFIQSITKPAINQASFTTKDFRKMKIFFPDFTEQTKIADFLSSVDERITLLNKQYERLNHYKKGLLQKVFSQRFKFKDKNGKDFPEWIRTSLEKVSDVRDGTHSSPIAQLEGYPLITSKNLIGSRGIDFDNITYISKKDYDEINKRSLVSEGDLLFSMIGTIGNLALVNDTGFAIKNVGLIKELSKLKNEFLFFYLQFLVGSGYFELIKSGNTQKFISLSTLRKLEVPCPIINEQIIITNFFHLIDEKIAVKKTELDKLKTWKQGLLQQMFV